MNLLVLAHRVPYPPNKGEKIRTFHQLEYLSQQGHDITLVTPLEDPAEATFAEQLQDRLHLNVQHARLPAGKIRIIKSVLSAKPVSATHFYSAKLQQFIDASIESNTPDTLMCTSSAMAEYVFNKNTMEKVRKYDIRLVMDFMDLDSVKWEHYVKHKPWPLSLVYKRESRLLAQMESRILETFDASLFVSLEESVLLQSEPELRDKIHVVTNGVDTNTYYPAAKDECSNSLFNSASPVFLFTGVMDYFPNEDAVLWFAEHVWPDILQQYPEAKFVIAGMRPSRKIKNLALEASIEVTGYLDNILPYYQQADFLVAPFRVARGIQNKILQAMACGLPVLSSSEGAAGINCTADEHLLVVNSPAAYLDAVHALHNEESNYRRISDAGRAMVAERYSWKIQNVKLESLLSGKPSFTSPLDSKNTAPARPNPQLST